MNKKDVIGSLGKALSVLECFSADTPRLTISEAAGLTGLDRAAARRYLISLEYFGYLESDGKFYRPTIKVLRLGVSSLSSMPLPQIVQPWLDQLSEELQQSCSVSVLDGDEIVYIARASQKRVMSVGLMPGSRLPAHCTSMGRVLLAYSDSTIVNELLSNTNLTPLTPYTLSNLDAIKAELEKVKKEGFAVVDQEVELGLRSIAIPLYSLQGNVVAALNTGIPSIIAEPEQMRKLYLPAMIKFQKGVRRFIH
ncbi:IclR family transcriptional regulator domain-containing protein [Marinobacterium mangrovicola]|uniref:IclR family transcriptional regulator n=1 Tax=Marinobacterium mangrovicola TaxID=1476959 RepID=A0A4R1G8Y4_9GAMM|nr:IclR family transcriptional regulator C-terminal domain-containing protein [Marinobacterium mangrovicola]TCK02935.1 IclR family transcriptional regulator [Marinobacterium mangrovicola]